MNKEKIEHLLNSSITNITTDTYNHTYDAYTFETARKSFRYRTAKITPKKAGGFVVMWIKDTNDVNIPFTYDAFPDFLIVEINTLHESGHFIFPKDVLRDNNILSNNNTGGKMGFRVYPSCAENLNATALKTQEWQIKYFKGVKHAYKN